MKRVIFIHTVLIMVFLSALCLHAIVVSPPGRHYVGDTLSFRPSNSAFAYAYRADWNFGDGTTYFTSSGMETVTHTYSSPGSYRVQVVSQSFMTDPITEAVTVLIEQRAGIDDQVNLEIAEVRLDNGKYYKIVPKNSKNIRAILRMKMRGTGIVAGHWIVDGHPFEFFSEVAYQGKVKEIYTRTIPGLPTIDPGIHTITLQLTRPRLVKSGSPFVGSIQVTFPVLKYFVLPYENIIKTLTPPDGFVAKEKEIPEFSWEEPKGASKYQVAFSNYLYTIMGEGAGPRWIDVGTKLKYTPDPETWNRIHRNRLAYWKVRALDTNNNVVAESDIQDIKVVITTAEISIDRVTDLEGNEIAINRSGVTTRTEDLLVHGSIEYKGNSQYLVLRVYVDNEITDQLLFRDVKKNEKRYFETSIPNKKKTSRIRFKVLKISSPAVIVGIKGLILRR